MKRLTVLALVLVCACSGGYSNGNIETGGIPTGHQDGGGSDGGDAGPDAGADAGPDAGCVAVVGMTVAAIDSCVSASPQSVQATLYVTAPDAGNACATSITLTSATGACSGTASQGSLNAFTGLCAALSCTSPSLPGTLTCTGGCTIRICDAGVCGP